MPINTIDASTALLLHFNEAGGEFIDSSLRRAAGMSKTGTASGASALSKFGSHCFQGAATQANNDGLLVAAFAQPFPSHGPNPFTFDAWIYITAYPVSLPQMIFGIGSDSAGALVVIVTTTGRLSIITSSDGNMPTQLTGATNIPLNQWNHIAVCKAADGTTRLFLNGAIDASSTTLNFKTVIVNETGVTVGYNISSSGWSFTGRIDELRYVVNMGLLTSDFSASLPSAPYTDPDYASRPGSILKIPFRLTGYAPTPVGWKVGPNSPIMLRDTYYGGRGRIFGTVKEKDTPSNTPLARKVRLHREIDGRLASETVSDAVTGNYAFENIDETQRYTVITYDYEQNYRAVIADNLTPELMT